MSGSRRKPGPLGPFVEGYRAWLLGRGYSPSVVIRSLIALGHLGRWMEREALPVDQLTAATMSAFLAEYRSDRGRLPTASMWPLLEYLRAEAAVPPEPPAVVAPVEQLVGAYREWLLGERGLAPVTVRGSEQFARRFLTNRVSAGDPRGVWGITAAEVNDFLCASARG
jgi:integrase/recombinase XerD